MTTITFKKVATKLIVTISVIAMMFCFGGINASASTKAQDIAHQNAENARLNFGMVDNSLPVRSQSLLWWYESGNTNAAKSWFYDALQQKYFDFFGNEIQNPNVSNSSSSNSTNSNYRGDTISYGSYTWTWDGSQYYRWENGKKIALSNQSNQSQSYTTTHTSNGIAFEWDDYRWYQTNDGKFYRWDGKGDNKKIVWATSKENEKILKKGDYLGNTYYDTYTTSEAGRPSEKYQYWDGKYAWYQDASTGRYYRWEGNTKIWWDSQNSSSSNQNNQNNSNPNQNNNNSNLNENMFSGYNFHSGLIAAPSDSWTDGQAKLLVQMTYPYIKDLTSQTSQAQMMWVALNIANGSDLSNATSAFPEFNASLDAANAKDSSGRSLMALAKDVLFRDKAERNKWSDNGRVLPSQYTYFSITGQKVTFKTSDGTVYNNILKTPYTS